MAAILIHGMVGIARAEEPDSISSLDKAINEIVANEISEGRIVGAVVGVGFRGRALYRKAFGKKAVVPEPPLMTVDTIFDLASLTKVVATTTAVMQLVEKRKLSLTAPVARYWPDFGQAGKAAITVEQLMTHTSGLRAGLDLSGRWTGERTALSLIEGEGLRHPPGTQFIYSDINFIALAELVKRTSGKRLDRYANQHVFARLRQLDTGFQPDPAKQPRIAPTENVNGELRWGHVQDPTARRMDGVAGHAGLFSTIDDLCAFAEMLLGGGVVRNVRILSAASIELMTRDRLLPNDVHRGLGWDISSPYSGGMDRAFGPGSYGHTGYTGTSMWLQPATGAFLITLTSRLHPDGKGDVRLLRERLSQTVAKWAK